MTCASCTYNIRTWRLISLSFKPDMIDGRIRSRWNFIFDDDDFKTFQVKDPSTSESAQNWALGHPRCQRASTARTLLSIVSSKSSKWKFFSSRWISEVECTIVLSGMFRWKMSSTLPFLTSESKNQNQASPSSLIFCQQTFRSIDKIGNSGAAEPPELTRGQLSWPRPLRAFVLKDFLASQATGLPGIPII